MARGQALQEVGVVMAATALKVFAPQGVQEGEAGVAQEPRGQHTPQPPAEYRPGGQGEQEARVGAQGRREEVPAGQRAQEGEEP